MRFTSFGPGRGEGGPTPEQVQTWPSSGGFAARRGDVGPGDRPGGPTGPAMF